jgi:site-specific recombinase XerD
VLCLLDSGLRASEFVALNVSDYNRRSGEVMVRQGKGRKGRVSFFGPRARAELQRYLFSRGKYRDGDPLFLSERGYRRLGVSGREKVLNRLGALAAVHVTPHSLRRTTATWAHRDGWSLESIRRLLGHSDFTVLRRYLALDSEDIADAHRNAPPSGRL